MKGYRELLEKEVIEAWRTYRIALVAIGFVALGIGVPVLVRYLPALVRTFGPADLEIGLEETGVADVVDVLVPALVQLGGLVAILLAMGAVAGERERGTAAFVLSKAIGRGPFLWAKFVGPAMVLGLGVALAALAAWLYTALLFGATPVMAWAQMALLVWLSTLVFASITLLGSVVAPSPLGAAAFGVAALAGLTLASAVVTLTPWLPTGLGDVARAVALEEMSPDLDPSRTVLVSIGVAVVALAIAWLHLRRQDA